MKYAVIYGTGTAWVAKEIVEVNESTTDYGVILDIAIDQIESRGEIGKFISYDEIEKDEIGEDMYITGGNHGLNLMHYGILDIEEV